MGGVWSKEEERDYEGFLASLDVPIEDPDLLAFLAPVANCEFLDLEHELPGAAEC